MKNAKLKKRNFYLLFSAAFLHLFSLFCSVYRDVKRPPEGFDKFAKMNYWLTFFGWWCGWASLITIIYFVYKLFKKSNHNYFDKVFELIVINANIITISIFTISVVLRLQALPKSDKNIEIFCWEVSSRNFWWFYSVIWHYLAPILTIIYFARRKISLAKTYFERRQLFLYSFLHPIIYFVYVLVRPNVSGASEFIYSESCPRYPYFFFELITSSKTNDIIRGLVIIAVIFFWLFAFWFATLFFWWYSNHKIKEKKVLFCKFSSNKK
ncbi:MAG: hypothetical protein LBR43_00310 [Spiroplasmataceae bacterium]|jgi:hypothetical protein|nr:hypothetical protein [Spiroplasmataceae bacterium]